MKTQMPFNNEIEKTKKEIEVLTKKLSFLEELEKTKSLWKKIFDEISIADDHIMGKINYYNLASILEDLYVENAELKARVEALEKLT